MIISGTIITTNMHEKKATIAYYILLFSRSKNFTAQIFTIYRASKGAEVSLIRVVHEIIVVVFQGV